MTNLNSIKKFLDSNGVIVQYISQDPKVEIKGCCMELLRRHGNLNVKLKLTKYDLNE